MRERDALEDQLAAIGRIEQELDDQRTMIDLGKSEKDEATVVEAEAALKRLRAEVGFKGNTRDNREAGGNMAIPGWKLNPCRGEGDLNSSIKLWVGLFPRTTFRRWKKELLKQ